jgi:hypothetical protein
MAGLRGATDAATFGLSDKYEAADFALRTLGQGGTVIDRYQALRERQTAQDQYDRDHYGVARTVGEGVGVVGSILATGGLGAAPIGVGRLGLGAARTAKFGLKPIMRAVGPQAAVATAGAATSAAGQVVGDFAAGEWSSPEAYLSSLAGGAAGALTTLHRGPQAGATAEALVTHGAHGALTGEPISLEDLSRDVFIGRQLGRLGERVGIDWSEGLPSFKWQGRRQGRISKEGLGEAAGELHSLLRGDLIEKRQKYFPVSGGKTRADAAIRAQDPSTQPIHEFKLGRSAHLTKRQLEAQAEYGDRYNVFHYLPADVGKVAGGTLGLFGAQASSHEDNKKPYSR